MKDVLPQSKIWMYKSIIFLAINGGFVNSITFEGFFHNPVGYVTGNITFAANYLVSLNFLQFIAVLAAVGAFLLGSLLSGIIALYNDFTKNNKYNLAFIIEIILITLGMLGLIVNISVSKYLLAMALGLQNGATTFYGTSVIRTTHMTGTMTDLGIALAYKLLKKDKITLKTNEKIFISIYLILSFFIGSILGIMCFKLIGYYGLTFSIIACIIMVSRQILTT